MIIDKILDRLDAERDGDKSYYSPKEFYDEMMYYEADKITKAMDYGTEKDVKLALVNYIITNEYNPRIAMYICSVDWLVGGPASCQNGQYDIIKEA